MTDKNPPEWAMREARSILYDGWIWDAKNNRDAPSFKNSSEFNAEMERRVSTALVATLARGKAEAYQHVADYIYLTTDHGRKEIADWCESRAKEVEGEK